MKRIIYIIIFIIFIFSIIKTYLLINTQPLYIEDKNIIKGKVVNIENNKDKTILTIKSKYKYQVDFKGDFKYNLGDLIILEGEFYTPMDNDVFNLFNYRKYLLSKNIIMIGTARRIKLISNNKNIFYLIKNNMLKHIEKYKTKGYLKVFILSDKSSLEDIIEKSQYLGINHLFSISGMHVALVMYILNKVLKKYKYKKIIIFIFLLLLLFFTNFTISLIRCVLFLFINEINKKLKLGLKNIMILIVTASILLIYNSYLIYNIGFVFSVIITFFILLSNKKNNYIFNLIYVSIISFLATIPILSYSFLKINLLTIINNIIFIPIISFLLFPLSVIVLFFPCLDELYLILTNCFEGIISLFCLINKLNVIISKPRLIFIVLYYIFLVLSLKINFKYIICFFIIFIINLNSNFFINAKEIICFSVGQGDSSLLTFEKGKSILIDTGGIYNLSISTNKIIPYLYSKGIKNLEYLILTHGDFDHMGEAINLVNNFNVEKVIFNCGEFNDLEQDLIKVLDNKKIPYYSCIKELNIDNNKLYFLNDKDYGNENDNSSVIYTQFNNHKFLFMGDAGVEVEEDLIEKYNLQDIDVLKVGHHGSKTSSGKDFINEINPKYSIISVGKNNRYGHPNKEVLDTLEDSKIYRTDQDGSIMFKFKNNKLKIDTCSP